ncbi:MULTISPECIES: FecCD family ABC transporter permease [Synergistaceae]|jgi:iron complex transport system permease protein|uniref:FecCD family ABC transporter permease n=1 Tax=Synergistaceae TaxID=649777 RepID=UPI003ADAD378|nr:iron ABC transporter permease [Synergistaceae bacterium DZ-S4]
MRRLALPFLFIFSLAVVAVAPFIGMQNIGISDLLGGADENIIRIMWDLRVPRVLLGWITGSTLALCGLIFQALFRNPLASPDMLGVSTGAAFGAVVYIRTGIVFSLFGAVSGLSLAAFAGALAATFAIYAAGNLRRGGMSEATLLLAGVAMSFLFGSLNMIIQFTGGYIDTFRMMRWSMGGIQAVGFGPVLATLPALAVIFAVAFVTAPELNLFVCGEDIAASRGVSVVRLRRLLFFSVSIVIGINVATCGPIGFVGLLGPHICRKFVGTDHRKLALASLFFGGAFLVLCDTAARILWSPAEVPVGVLTSFIGSIFFLWLLVRGRR